jgi:hypothetical protein
MAAFVAKVGRHVIVRKGFKLYPCVITNIAGSVVTCRGPRGTNWAFELVRDTRGGRNRFIETAVTANVSWWFAEYSGIDTVLPPVVGLAGTASATPATTRSTGTTAVTTDGTGALVLCTWGGSVPSGNAVFSGYTNGLQELAQVTTADAGPNVPLAVAYKWSPDDQAYSSTATVTPAAAGTGLVVVYKKV